MHIYYFIEEYINDIIVLLFWLKSMFLCSYYYMFLYFSIIIIISIVFNIFIYLYVY